MAKKIESAMSELTYILDWCSTINEFVYHHAIIQSDYEDIYVELKKVFETVLGRKDLRGARIMYKEIVSMSVPFINPFFMCELNEVLREKFGEDLNTFDDKMTKKVNRILKRGFIKTEGECHMLVEWIDYVGRDTGREAEIEAVEDLIFKYDDEKYRFRNNPENKDDTQNT